MEEGQEAIPFSQFSSIEAFMNQILNFSVSWGVLMKFAKTWHANHVNLKFDEFANFLHAYLLINVNLMIDFFIF